MLGVFCAFLWVLFVFACPVKGFCFTRHFSDFCLGVSLVLGVWAVDSCTPLQFALTTMLVRMLACMMESYVLEQLAR